MLVQHLKRVAAGQGRESSAANDGGMNHRGLQPKDCLQRRQRVLKHVEVSGDLAEAAKRAGDAAGLNTERTLQEVCRAAFSDPRKFFREDGSIKPPSEWDADMAAAVASYEIVGGVTGIKFCDKLAALEQAMRHFGLYQRDLRQRQENLGAIMVREGFAWAFTRFSVDYVDQQEEALRANRGVHAHDCMPAWEWRAPQRR
jgi:hypothetical protein